MQITSDNVHGSAPFPAALVGEQTKFTGSKEPMPLSNQTPLSGPRFIGQEKPQTEEHGLRYLASWSYFMSKQKPKPPQNNPPTHPHHDSSQKESNYRNVYMESEVKVDLVQDLREKYETTHRESTAHNKKQHFWVRVSAGLIFIAAGITAYQAYLFRESVQIDQRPYVWDNNAKPAISIAAGQRMWANISMINYGKSPALKLRIAGKIFIGPTAMTDADQWFAQIGDKPFLNDPHDNGTVVPPGIPPPLQPLSEAELSKPVPAGKARSESATFAGGGMFTIMSDRVLQQPDVDYVLGNEESAIIVAHLQYFDGFGNFYWSNICISRFINGAVPHCTRHNEIH